MKHLTGDLLPVTEGGSLIIVAGSTAVGSRYGIASVAENLTLIQEHEAERNGRWVEGEEVGDGARETEPERGVGF